MQYILYFFRRVFKSIGCLLLLLIIITEGWLVIGVRINGEPPAVREYVIESDKITSPVTIVMLSDLHGCEHPTLIDQIKAIAPDLILLCGDMINQDHKTGEDILVTAGVVKELSALAPVYYSLGNHELERIGLHDHDAVKRILAEGAILLDKSFVDLDIRGNLIRIGGLYTPNSAETEKPSTSAVEGFLAKFCSTDSFRILLEHRPAAAEAILTSEYAPELTLSGHLHGGHVILPFLGPVYGANSGFFPKYALGMFEFGTSKLIVSAGLSTERHIIPRVNNPTEITKIVLE